MSIRLVLADNHRLFLDGLELLLRPEPEFEVFACCEDGLQALHAVRHLCPDIFILDLDMPGKHGLEILWEIHQVALPTRVVLLTASIEEDDLLEALRRGVGGVVLKDMTAPLLMQCIHNVYAGDQELERRSISRALDKMRRREAGPRELTQLLTPRERETVCLAARGLCNKDIADQLAISEGTVKRHLHRSYEKLQVHSCVALLRYA